MKTFIELVAILLILGNAVMFMIGDFQKSISGSLMVISLMLFSELRNKNKDS